MATSITNTSISTDTINVDNGVLYVDNTSNCIGVNKTNPVYNVDVSGRVRIDNSDTNAALYVTRNAPSPVTTDADIVSAAAVYINGNEDSGSDAMRIGAMHNGTGDYYIDVSNYNATANYDLLLQPLRGNVGIGVTAALGTLHVGSGDIVFGSGGEQPGNGNTQTGIGFRTINTGTSVMFSVSRLEGNTCRFNRNGSAGSNVNMSHDGGNVGSIDTSTTGTTYNTTSDLRLKENIVTITDGKEKLLAMNPVTHTWKADPDVPAVHGFIAQEIQTIIPEAVQGSADGDEMMSMDYGRITPVIVAALQDALKEIEELKTRISELENK